MTRATAAIGDLPIRLGLEEPVSRGIVTVIWRCIPPRARKLEPYDVHLLKRADYSVQ